MNYGHNKINYIEFQAEDLVKIKAFILVHFGWKFVDYGTDYVAFSDRSLDGGFAKGEHKSSGAPLVIIYARDLEQVLAIIEQYGGTIVKPMYAFPGGRRFHFTDPSGNELAVWSDK